MTLNIQKKGKAHLNNESIFNNIIKKENGVNPFLTVMNFKISFKTWLKQSKVIKANQNKLAGIEDPALNESALNKQVKTVIVDIEVEHDLEFTSEEDSDDAKSVVDQDGRSGVK